MPKPLSIDLRERVLAAVAGAYVPKSGGRAVWGGALNRDQVGCDLAVANGRDRPLTAGGDRRSHPIETHAEAILAWLAETPDVTLAEVTADLARQRGLQVSRSTVWRFFARRAITFKKKTAHLRAGTPRCGTAPTGVAGWPTRSGPCTAGLRR